MAKPVVSRFDLDLVIDVDAIDERSVVAHLSHQIFPSQISCGPQFLICNLCRLSGRRLRLGLPERRQYEDKDGKYRKRGSCGAEHIFNPD